MADPVSDNATDYPPDALMIAVIAAVWFAVASQLLWLDWDETTKALGDTDDALRLVQVRELLAGRGWFDLHEPRLQPPLGYDTHWSRLIDGGLAGLFLVFRWFTDVAFAERLMRAVWPLLWLLPAIVGAVLLALRLGGRGAAYVVLLLLLFGLPAYIQFRVGRIDHHDVQIALALLTVAAAIWADRVHWAPWIAGALSALALAVGFEGMAFILVAGGLFVLRYIFDRNAAPAMSRYGQSLTAATAIVFFASIGPSQWMQTACDAMAINSAAPAAVGGLYLAIAARRFAVENIAVRCAAIVMTVVLAIVVFIVLEPRCIRGPLAMVDPAVQPIWLSHVNEAQSLLATTREKPLTGFGIASYPLAAIVATIVLACDKRLLRDDGFIAAAAALIVSVVLTLIAIRASPYTIWFAMPFVAAALLRLFGWLGVKTLPVRALLVLPFTPIIFSWGAIALAESIAPPKVKQEATVDAGCFKNASYAPLAQLPAGLVIADIDYGPYLLALTPHSAIAAPYHRMSYGIMTSHRVFAAPPDEARDILRHAKADYVTICGTRGPLEQSDGDSQRSLWMQLRNGNVPAWLEPVQSGAFTVYRFKP
jgi:hypothetical protein